jgi:hypothetical protein
LPGNDLTAHIQPALAAHTRPPLATRKRTCRCRSSRAARASRRCVWRCTCARNPDAQERYLGSEYFVVSIIPWAPDTVSGRPNPKDGAVQAAVKPSTSYVHPRHQLRRQRVRLSEAGTARSKINAPCLFLMDNHWRRVEMTSPPMSTSARSVSARSVRPSASRRVARTRSSQTLMPCTCARGSALGCRLGPKKHCVF